MINYYKIFELKNQLFNMIKAVCERVLINMRIGVAVIDTGIYRHLDFDNRIAGFVDFVNGRISPYDDSGHGTHVSGIIAGSGKCSNGRYRGIEPKAQLVSIKVLDNVGNGRIENVLNGLEWVYKNHFKYNIRVLNISFGATSENELNEESDLIYAVEKIWDCGIVVVAAAGNSGPDRYSITAPGISRKVITVGAFDDMAFQNMAQSSRKNSKERYNAGKSIRYYSGRGPTKACIVKPELVVTGSNIVACSNKKNSYTVKSGTSMSAPIVSGAVARLLRKYPDMTPKEVKVKIKKCCKKINLPLNQQGWGMLDLTKFISGE